MNKSEIISSMIEGFITSAVIMVILLSIAWRAVKKRNNMIEEELRK